jgi:ribonuclease VapC
MKDEAASLVLDASALLAYLHEEPGAATVEEALAAGAIMNAVNYAEVLSRLSDAGEDALATHHQLQDQELIGGLLDIVVSTIDDAITMARLRALTRTHGLSLGDRACLATAIRLGRPVLTADRTWTALNVGATVRLIRP